MQVLRVLAPTSPGNYIVGTQLLNEYVAEVHCDTEERENMNSMPPAASLSWSGGAPRELLARSALAVQSSFTPGHTHGAGDTWAVSFPHSPTSHSHGAPTSKAGWVNPCSVWPLPGLPADEHPAGHCHTH